MEKLIKKSDAIEVIKRCKDRLQGKGLTYEIMLDMVERIPSADRPRGEWIPCSERMPEPGSWAIWCSIKGIIQVARWKEDAIDHFFPDQGFFDLEDAVAWMPLPEPWKGTDDE